MSIHWETIDGLTERMSIPFGWIVRTTIIHQAGSGIAVHMVIVQDPMHLWGPVHDPVRVANVPEPEGKH